MASKKTGQRGNFTFLQTFGIFIDAGGVGPLARIEGIMTKEVYRDLLRANLLPYWKRNRARFDEFQQDGDPKHTAGIVKRWFRHPRVNIPVMKCPNSRPQPDRTFVGGTEAKISPPKYQQQKRAFPCSPRRVGSYSNGHYSRPN